jgi:hypothetical protein
MSRDFPSYAAAVKPILSGSLDRPAAGPFVVVALEVLAEDALKVARVADQEPVEALCADGSDEAFGRGVRDGRADRRLEGADPFAREHGVEGAGELAVAVSDQELRRGESRFQRGVAGLLGNPAAGRGACSPPALPGVEARASTTIGMARTGGQPPSCGARPEQ